MEYQYSLIVSHKILKNPNFHLWVEQHLHGLHEFKYHTYYSYKWLFTDLEDCTLMHLTWSEYICLHL